MTTVLECLQCAEINFTTLGAAGLSMHPIYRIAMDQLRNAIQALGNGQGADHVLQEHLGGEVDTGGPDAGA